MLSCELWECGGEFTAQMFNDQLCFLTALPLEVLDHDVRRDTSVHCMLFLQLSPGTLRL